MQSLRTVALRHFANDGKARHQTPEYKQLMLERDSDLKLLAELRTALHAEGALIDTRARLKHKQGKLRALRRHANAQHKVETEDRLECALRDGRKSEAQFCSRLLAQKSLGVQKRRLNTLCTFKPEYDELLQTAELAASSGGLSGVQVDWEEEQR